MGHFLAVALAAWLPAAAWGAEPFPAFSDVLAAPDDPELNERFARSRMEAGDLTAALTAWERVLSARPQRRDLRVLYAITLFRLDDWEGAAREIDGLSGAGLPEDVSRQLSLMRAEIRRRRARTRVTGVLGARVDSDSNRNAAPLSGKRLVEDRPVHLRGDLLAQFDRSYGGFASVELRRDLGLQARHDVFMRLDLQRTESSKFRVLDAEIAAAQAGGTLHLGGLRLVPWGGLDHVRLSRETFLRAFSGGLRAERDLSPSWGLYGEGSLAYLDFSRISDVNSAAERSGRRAELGTGLWVSPTSTLRVRAGLAVARQEAARAYNAFERASINLAPEWLPGRGVFVQGAFGYALDRYEAPDPIVSTRLRSDDIHLARATVGVSLGVFVSWLRDVYLAQSLEYQHAVSNLENFEYENKKLSTQLSYAFGWAR
ncbi:MAG: hypothetical protein HY553_04285 [Elusimicrobia bacterium]|nr:hypothetical protein [Elusimicrobiota bacterium]